MASKTGSNCQCGEGDCPSRPIYVEPDYDMALKAYTVAATSLINLMQSNASPLAVHVAEEVFLSAAFALDDIL